MNELPHLMTVAEVAQYLRVSPLTVRRLAASGDLPSVRVGRQYRIPRDQLVGATATDGDTQ